MTPNLIQRHQDYVLGSRQDPRLKSVAAGASIAGITLQTDSDAPFLLRSRAMRVKYSASRTQVLGNLLLRFAGPDRDYRSQDMIRQSLLGPYFGQLGNPIPEAPEVFYPRSSPITVDIYNDGATALTNLVLYFRGVKLFAPGAVRSYNYPAIFSGFPFTYPVGDYSDTDGLTLVRNIPVVQTGRLRQTFRVKTDADFVLRGGQAGLPFSTTPVNEVFVTLRDEDEKPYSNDGVHMDVLFGNSGFGATFAAGGGNITPVATGPNSPGLFFPEIYVPKNHLMYVDIQRDDSSFTGATVINLPISFLGQKVFQK